MGSFVHTSDNGFHMQTSQGKAEDPNHPVSRCWHGCTSPAESWRGLSKLNLVKCRHGFRYNTPKSGGTI